MINTLRYRHRRHFRFRVQYNHYRPTADMEAHSYEISTHIFHVKFHMNCRFLYEIPYDISLKKKIISISKLFFHQKFPVDFDMQFYMKFPMKFENFCIISYEIWFEIRTKIYFTFNFISYISYEISFEIIFVWNFIWNFTWNTLLAILFDCLFVCFCYTLALGGGAIMPCKGVEYQSKTLTWK